MARCRPAVMRARSKVALGAGGILGLAATVGGAWLARQVDPPGPSGEKVSVSIPPGTTVAGIADRLEDGGVLSSAGIFRLYLKAKGADDEFQSGQYELAERMPMGAVLAALKSGPEIRLSRLTIPEGLTVEEIAGRVGKLPGRNGDRFLALARSGQVRSRWQPAGVATLEGLLFPDTYLVAESEDEAAIIGRLVERFDDVAAEVGLTDGPGVAGLGPYQTVVAASLVEAEAKVAEDRPLIASVIENRLNKGMRLQIDATVLYALGEHKDRVLLKDLEVDSPYNTYRVEGLPPTPIGAPGRASLEAMLDPADTGYLYYVLIEENGKHGFAADAATFERLKAESRRKGLR